MTNGNVTDSPTLRRPVWSALTGRQAHLSQGNAHARRFNPDYSPFGAPADMSAASVAALTPLIPNAGALWLFEMDDIPPPVGTVLMRATPCLQMIAPSLKTPRRDIAFAPLTDDDGPDMRALALLTEPGPFLPSTHRLGAFVGVKREGVLVAMAGERLSFDGFTEVSGVCTHPAHRGRGYANGLVRAVAASILARGELPILHVNASNTGAIAVYESLGFITTRTFIMTVLAQS